LEKRLPVQDDSKHEANRLITRSNPLFYGLIDHFNADQLIDISSSYRHFNKTNPYAGYTV